MVGWQNPLLAGAVVLLAVLFAFCSRSPRTAPGAALERLNASFGLATHVSVDKVYFLPEISIRWDGPMAVAIFLPDRLCAQADALLESTRRKYTLPPSAVLVPVCGDYQVYPANRLRNAAVAALTTSHVLMVDVDLMPSTNLRSVLAGLPAEYLVDDSRALVVPAMEWTHYDCDSTRACFDEYRPLLPRTKDQLTECMKQSHCGVFYHYFAPDTHADTMTDRWLLAEEPYDIPCFRYPKYEPYVVVRKSSVLPTYDERFLGYGKNKIQFIAHLRALGYSFHVVPHAFVVHMPHRESTQKEKWMSAETGQKAHMDALYEVFIRELEEALPNQFTTPHCSS